MSGYLVPRLAPGESVEVEAEVSRSRFRARIVGVEDEAGARHAIEEVRRAHRDAGHHCSAFVIGAGASDTGLARSSDDGEPSGTAGAPMLEALHGAGVGDVVAVVSRWFGGTLLGAGGLVRAYGDVTRAGLAQAGTRRRSLLVEVELVLGHGEAGRVESELRSRGVLVLDVAYATEATLRLGVPPGEVEALHALVAELTAGRADADVVGERWVDG